MSEFKTSQHEIVEFAQRLEEMVNQGGLLIFFLTIFIFSFIISLEFMFKKKIKKLLFEMGSNAFYL